MKGILFKPYMILAIVEGRKTQTRRIAYVEGEVLTRPRYQVGETVYIKEAIHRFNQKYASYDSDFTPVMFLLSANRFHWRWARDKLSPMFLPREAARYFIRVKDVRAERLQDIADEDAQKEGVTRPPNYSLTPYYREWFKWLWNNINKYPYRWEDNPWVWKYSFEKEEQPC